MTGVSKRERLIAVAADLFARNGYHATGIDLILETAGVAKKTLYTHFRSKEELIIAVLRHHDSVFRNGFMREVEQAAAAPRERLLAIFDVAEAWFRGSDFYGCMFINAVGEYSLEDTPIRQACKEFKALMWGYFEKLGRDAGAADPKELADRLALLLEGAIVTAQVSRAPEAAKVARDAAAVLIDRAIPTGNQG
jgi:AcrR family transcriptional regulator